MATKNQLQLRPGFDEEPLVCDLCHSYDISQNEYGYVCRHCGAMLDLQILEYHRPYNQDIVQYAPLSKTQIGFKRERIQNAHSYRLKRLNTLDSYSSSDEKASMIASIELNRIFEALNLPQSDKKKVLHGFIEIREQLGKGTKYRTPEKLIPLLIYFYYKEECRPIDEQAILNVSKISKKDFQAFKLQIRNFKPDYKLRKRQLYIIHRIMEITENFGLDMYFYYQSKKILYKLWDAIKNTKDDVIAGLCTSISALCLPERPLTVSDICRRLHIRMSTIHSQVEHKIFEHLRVPGFKSLVQSADLLKEIIRKLGILMEEFEEKGKKPEVIEIRLGDAQQVFNAHDTLEYYLFAIPHHSGTIIFLSVVVDRHHIKEQFDRPPLSHNNLEQQNKERNDLLFNLEVWKVKSPPLMLT